MLAPAFSRLNVEAEVTVCSSSGWAHGARVTGRKVVYCHTPARWLYQTERYLAGSSRWASLALSLHGPVAPTLGPARPRPRAHRYLVNSTAVRQRVADLYGIDAEVVPPPVDVDPRAAGAEVAGIEPGFLLCVSRLLPYKNVEAVTEAFAAPPRPAPGGGGDGTAGRPDPRRRPAQCDRARAGRRRHAPVAVPVVRPDWWRRPTRTSASPRWRRPASASPPRPCVGAGSSTPSVEGTTGVFFDRPEPRLIADAVGP